MACKDKGKERCCTPFNAISTSHLELYCPVLQLPVETFAECPPWKRLDGLHLILRLISFPSYRPLSPPSLFKRHSVCTDIPSSVLESVWRFGGGSDEVWDRETMVTHLQSGQRRISACAFRQHGIVFQSIDEVMRYHGLKLLNKRGILLLHNFGMQISPFKLEKFLKNHRRQEKDMVKSVHEGHYLKTQIMALKAMTRGTFWVNVV